MFEVQCKSRGGQPAYLKYWLSEIVRSAAARQRIGVVVWKEPGRGNDIGDALVVMRFRDFVDLHGVPEEFRDGENTDVRPTLPSSTGE